MRLGLTLNEKTKILELSPVDVFSQGWLMAEDTMRGVPPEVMARFLHNLGTVAMMRIVASEIQKEMTRRWRALTDERIANARACRNAGLQPIQGPFVHVRDLMLKFEVRAYRCVEIPLQPGESAPIGYRPPERWFPL